jgi:type I site-specific restriction endonuclease
MIATGTDVKPIEVLIFMRDVRSELYFEQMKGRGVRSIDRDKLLDVTPDAKSGKERFVIVDAVGVTESRKTTMQPLERQRHVGFKKLLEHVASGDRRDDTLTTLAARLTTLDQKIEPKDRARIRTLTGGPTSTRSQRASCRRPRPRRWARWQPTPLRPPPGSASAPSRTPPPGPSPITRHCGNCSPT